MSHAHEQTGPFWTPWGQYSAPVHLEWSSVGDPTNWNPSARTVLAHGCFDLLHLGHIRHLKEAKAQGDWLIVSVTSDRFVRRGADRPRFTVEERIEALKALRFVDEVIVSDSDTAVEVINRVKPAVYVKGLDYAAPEGGDKVLACETDAVRAIGGRLHITTTQKWSSSRLINTERFSDEMLAYLDHARRSGMAERIATAHDKAARLRIAFVGETIIDEYRYVEGLGRSSKELMLATVETGAEAFEGGVLAASKHGDWPQARTVTSAKTIRKTRFVDADFKRKLFDVYSARKLDLCHTAREQFRTDLREAVAGCDVVVVTDFGHGLMGAVERAILAPAKFLAVNAQTNAGNYGYNPVTKYASADYVCIDDPEARLATQMAEGPIGEVIREGLARDMVCSRFIVTHGRHGSAYRDDKASGMAPAFTTAGIDTMGAGDAVMAVTAPLVAAGLDLEAAALVGNVVGAIKVSILGHRRHVTGAEWMATVESLLK